jgi:hypothetical protein
MVIGEVATAESGRMVFEIWKTSSNVNESQKIEHWIELQ